MVDGMVFSRDLAMLLAQVAPVLVIAFIVEFRALAERASVEGRDVRVMLWIVFGSLALILAVCFLVVNGDDDLSGWPAAWAWGWTIPALGLLIAYVAMATWAAVRLTVRDTSDNTVRVDALDQRRRTPGWMWLLRGQPDPIHVVAAVIVRRDGRILACRRRPGKTAEGKWEFPGGKVEKGEPPAEALVRELREELNVRIRIVEPFTSDVTVVKGVPIRLSCYKVKVVGRKPTRSTDHNELRWLRRDELHTVDWSAADLPAVRALTK